LKHEEGRLSDTDSRDTNICSLQLEFGEAVISGKLSSVGHLEEACWDCITGDESEI